MERKRSLEIMVELLMDSHNYREAEDHSSVTYDIDIDEDGDSLFVYNSSLDTDAFYWADDIIKMTEALHLNHYVTRQKVIIGTTRYGDDIYKNLLGIRVY